MAREEDRSDRTGALSGRRLGAVAVLLATSVLLSRVMGFVREMVLAARIGLGPTADAYYAAFQIPDLLNYLLAGGALAVAFTPLYLRIQRDQGDEAAQELFRTVLGTLGAAVCLFTAALWIYADALVDLQFSAFDAETRELTVWLTRIVLPGQIFFVAGGIVRAVLMAHGRFAAQAAAPLLYNGSIIAGGLLSQSVEGFAWGALVGALLGGWVFPAYDLRHVGRIRFRLAPWDRGFRVYFWGALPLMIGLSLTTVDEWYERYFGAQLGVGVVAALAFARRLMMAPVAIVGQAVATATLPSLSSLHAEGREREMNDILLTALRATWVLSVMAGGVLWVTARPLIQVAYQRGAFDAADSERVAILLAWMACAVPGWVVQQVAIRAFFARNEMWRPMLLSTLLSLGAIPLYVQLGHLWGAQGLVLAGVFAINLNAVLTLGWARSRHGGPPLAPLLSTAVRGLLAVGPACWLAHWVQRGGEGTAGAILDLGLSAIVYLPVFIALVFWLGDTEMRETLRRLLASGRRMISRAPPKAGDGID